MAKLPEGCETAPNLETNILRIESERRSEQLVAEPELADVDHLLNSRLAPGQFDPRVKADVRQNRFTAVQEGAMPYAITETEHEVVHNPETNQRTFLWLGRTAVQNSLSGYRFHKHHNARRRVDVEVDESRYASEAMQPGEIHAFISPRMSRKDATLKEARQEHLGDDDALRISWLQTDPTTGNQVRKMKSLLVRDIPLSAWVAMLKDPANIFGKAIAVEDEESALSVMKVHRDLVLSPDQLPEGPITILKEATKYIDDPDLQQKVTADIQHYHNDQELMKQQAEFKADRWLEFECELAESLATGLPTSAIKDFIATMQDAWNRQELEVLRRHSLGENLEYHMTRELAKVLENMKQNTLLGGAAVLVGNQAVIKQLDQTTLQHVLANEQQMFYAHQHGQDFRMIEANNGRYIGAANIKVGGGCQGNSDRSKLDDPNPDAPESALDTEGNQSDADQNETNDWNNPNKRKWKKGICQVKACATRPGKTDVGPCSVCKNCQAKFDRGEDPTKDNVFTRVTKLTGKVSLQATARNQEMALGA